MPPKLSKEDRIPDEGLVGQYGPYCPNPGLVAAANTALGLGMPLLLTGDPGSGKSDFAWAASHALHKGAPPLRCQIRSTTTARELLYHYDALVRFTDVQSGEGQKSREPRHYIRLQPLGVALMSSSPTRPPVVLLDEIDKAPRDLPNDLLWELDEGHFEIPEITDACEDSEARDPSHPTIVLKRRMTRNPAAARPLVVITSNSERQLPDAFLRRCVFFHIEDPTLEQLVEIVTKRSKADHEGEQGTPPQGPLLGSLVRVFMALRQEPLTKKPTTAEMLQWVSALTWLHDRDTVADQIGAFALAIQRAGGKLPRGGPLLWRTLPGLSCLVKLREDLTTLNPKPSSSA